MDKKQTLQTQENSQVLEFCSQLSTLPLTKVYQEEKEEEEKDGGVDVYQLFMRHRESFVEVQKVEKYLNYKMGKSILTKKILIKVIDDFQSLTEETHLKERDIKMTIFMLNTLDYLNNCSLIKQFTLDQPQMPTHIQLAKDSINLSHLTPFHLSRLQEVKKQCFNKLQKTNRSYLISIPSRTAQIQTLYIGQKSFQILQYLMQQIRLREFPEPQHIKNTYLIFFHQLKQQLYPVTSQTMPLKELTLFYLFQFLVGFMSIQLDTFYSQKDYLKRLKQQLFSRQRQYMISYLFKTVESVLQRQQFKF